MRNKNHNTNPPRSGSPMVGKELAGKTPVKTSFMISPSLGRTVELQKSNIMNKQNFDHVPPSQSPCQPTCMTPPTPSELPSQLAPILIPPGLKTTQSKLSIVSHKIGSLLHFFFCWAVKCEIWQPQHCKVRVVLGLHLARAG